VENDNRPEEDILPITLDTDDKGRPITGIKSALPHGDLQSYGDKVHTVDAEDAFGDLEFEDIPVGKPEENQGNGKQQQQAAKGDNESADDAASEDEEEQQQQQQDDDDEAGDEQGTEDAGDAGDDEGKTVRGVKVDISEETYQYLIKLPKDQLIARGEKLKNEVSKVGTRLGQLEKVVGPTVMKALNDGEDLTVVKNLMADLPDPAFQEHISHFYEEHQRGADGSWKRSADYVPPKPVLDEILRLNAERDKLTVMDFFEGEAGEFDFNEAHTSPGSKSGIALKKFEQKKAEIESSLQELASRATQASQQSAVSAEEQVRKTQENWKALEAKHPELVDPHVRAEFVQYLKTNKGNLYDVYFEAFRASKHGQKTTRTLVLEELSLVNKNRSKKTRPKQSRGTDKQGKSFHDVDPKQREVVKSDADYFGDYEE